MRPRRPVLMTAAVIWFTLLCGSRENCDLRSPTLTCSRPSISLNAGSCVTLNNPCGTAWQNGDGFRLCNAPPGLSISTARVRGTITRQLCAAPDIAPLNNQAVPFLYTQVDNDFGEGNLQITIGTVLNVMASAQPSRINAGQSAQLTATARGGRGAYTYAWTPATTVSDPTIANPIATPMSTTLYTVTVTDEAGATATAQVILEVNVSLEVTATPAVIDVGQSSQLSAVLRGVPGPLTYAWTPAASLSDPSVMSPVATPAVTTQYTVTVTDVSGAQSTGSVVVRVNLQMQVSATPATIALGQSAQLLAAVQGGAPPYQYQWAPSGSLDSATIPNPVATPSSTTPYTVTVTDATGQTITDAVTVTVTNPSPVTACFSTIPAQPVAPGAVTIDMRCSVGAIVRYEIYFAYVPGRSPVFAGTSALYTTFFEAPLTLPVRVVVYDAQGNQDEFNQDVIIQ